MLLFVNHSSQSVPRNVVIWNPGHFHKNPGERDAMTKSGTIPVKPGWLEYMYTVSLSRYPDRNIISVSKSFNSVSNQENELFCYFK